MIIKKKIFTQRLNIKNLNLKNFNKDYPNWLNDKIINQYLESRFKTHNTKSVRKFIAQCRQKKNSILLGIFYMKNNLHIGNIKVDNIDRFHNKAEIGIMIGDKKYWNKNIATEAIIAVTKLCFDHLRIRTLFAGCYDCNKGSYKAFIKAGWKKNCIIKNFWKFKNKSINQIFLSVTK
jgi:RimJ/RimL family protein N-acetyltransferase